jgi:hypothetical protein
MVRGPKELGRIIGPSGGLRTVEGTRVSIAPGLRWSETSTRLSSLLAGPSRAESSPFPPRG